MPATIIIIAVLLGLVVLAVESILKSRSRGGCSGSCGGCSGCCSGGCASNHPHSDRS